jgi:hypothetical protein
MDIFEEYVCKKIKSSTAVVGFYQPDKNKVDMYCEIECNNNNTYRVEFVCSCLSKKYQYRTWSVNIWNTTPPDEDEMATMEYKGK